MALDAFSKVAEENPDNLAVILAHPLFENGMTDDQATAIAMSSSYDGGWLIANKPDLAIAIVPLPWVTDGVDDSEREAIRRMTYIGNSPHSETTVRLLLNMPWIADGISDGERHVIAWLEEMVREGYADISERLFDMPFLQTIEPADDLALGVLYALSHMYPETPSEFLARPQFKDGITDDQAMIVAMLRPVFEHAPDRVDALLDPSATTIERRTVELPLSGEVELAVVRTYPRTRGTLSSMDLLENAVREAEKLMDAPLPLSHVWLLFENVGPAGTNLGDYMVIRPEYDLHAHLIAHEVAHYYWRGNPSWIDEGMAEVMALVIESERTGNLVEARWTPCGVVENIKALEALDPEIDEQGFGCNYSLGRGLFLDLLQRLGEDAFWEGARELYAEKLRSGSYDIEAVRQAFGSDANAIISRWYGE